MRRVSLWLLSTIAVVVLLFSYRTSTGGSASATTVAAAPAPATTSAPPDSESGSPSSGSTSGSTSGGTFTGSAAQTRWGDVQVTITVSGGTITAVDVPVYPSGNRRDQEINSYAIPQLTQETLTAQSADVDTVSGATVTSDGYKQSLQSAIDAAHLS